MGNACSENENHQNGLQKRRLNANTPLEYKIVILGEGAVGKTSIAVRYLENKFTETHIVTLGANFQQPRVTLKSGTIVKMNLWDTTGEEKFKSMLPMYYKNAKGAILVYDIGNRKSFDRVEYWVEELNEHVKAENMVLFLVGNKKDLPKEKREILTETAEKFAEEQGMMFLEVSAKTGDNVSELFSTLAEELARRFRM